VMAGGNRSVSREHAGCTDDFRGFFKSLALLHEFARALEQHERRVTLIPVENRWLNAQRAQHAHASDTEDDLLTDTMFLVAAIQACRQLTITLLVLFDIGVHQIKRHGAQIDTPHDDKK